jgi:hypothetical protein
MTEYHLAQINIAGILAPIDDPIMADFLTQLPPVNSLKIHLDAPILQ